MAQFEEVERMKRTAKEWAAFNPVDVVWPTRESPLKAFQDAKADILKMAEAFRVIAYPAEVMMPEVYLGCLEDAVDFIKLNFRLADLDENA